AVANFTSRLQLAAEVEIEDASNERLVLLLGEFGRDAIVITNPTDRLGVGVDVPVTVGQVFAIVDVKIFIVIGHDRGLVKANLIRSRLQLPSGTVWALHFRLSFLGLGFRRMALV